MPRTECQNQYGATRTALRFPLAQTQILAVCSPPAGMGFIFLAKVLKKNKMDFFKLLQKGEWFFGEKKIFLLSYLPEN